MNDVRITILGYYGKKNLGDDLFQVVLQKWYPSAVFINPEAVSTLEPTDIILVGGGDLVNDYFMKKINALVATLDSTPPVYGISLGFPYPNLAKSREHLKSFDYILTRTTGILSDVIVPARYCDDIVWGLASPKKIVSSSFLNKPKPIGIFLASPMCEYTFSVGGASTFTSLGVGGAASPLSVGVGGSTLKEYQIAPSSRAVFNNLVKFFRAIADVPYPKFRFTKQYTLHFYCFNTNTNSVENDAILTRLVTDQLQGYSNVKVFTDPIEADRVVGLFGSFHTTICSRYHAHVLSLMAGVPLISLSSTNKVKDLLIRHELEKWAEPIQVDEKTLVPTDFSAESMLYRFERLIDSHEHVARKIGRITTATASTKTVLDNLIFNRWQQRLSKIEDKIEKYSRGKDPKTNAKLYSKIITFVLTRNETADFTWGLEDNLRKGQSVAEAVGWLIGNIPLPEPMLDSTVSFSQRKYNLLYFNMDIMKGVHRSGWQFVVDTLRPYHNPTGPIFDCYLDKTFGWNKEFLKKIGVLPFKKPWTGIFHHLPDTRFDKHNLTSIVKSRTFQSSLKTCIGLYVLSTYLAKWLRKHVDVPVTVLYHPVEGIGSRNTKGDSDNTGDTKGDTDACTKEWSRDAWKEGKRRVVQIGAWMRNVYAIYRLDAPHDMIKTVLKGRNMNNYFPPEDFFGKLADCFNGDSSLTIETEEVTASQSATDEPKTVDRLCRHRANKFMISLYNQIESDIGSVEVLEHLNNDDYDDLLSESVVFINLIDCSACNTILECMVRNVPILVNRLPAAEEYLGKEYPLFYDDIFHAGELLRDEKAIASAHRYLAKRDKSFLAIERFIGDVMGC